MISNHITDFAAYIALGDSMSIDTYPAIDLGLHSMEPLGAAALLFRNYDTIWPAYSHNDLVSRNPNLQFANLCVDGAITWDLLDDNALDLVQQFANDKVLITLTIGGNDLLTSIQLPNPDMVSATSEVVLRIETIAKKLNSTFPHAAIIMNTIYDPTDNSGEMPHMPSLVNKLPFLRYVNTEIKDIAAAHNALFADVYEHFKGHGIGKPDTYYWPTSPIEPSAKGASALRELWLDTLKQAKII